MARGKKNGGTARNYIKTEGHDFDISDSYEAPARSRKLKWPWAQLDEGQSFAFPAGVSLATARGAANTANGLFEGAKYKASQLEDGSIRGFRVAVEAE